MKNSRFIYENLANAIIQQAAKDYRKARIRNRKHPERDTYRYDMEALERFFFSRWFGLLTTIDPEMLIAMLKKEVDV